VGTVRGPVTGIAAQPIYLDVFVDVGSEFVQPVPQGHTTLAYVFEGQGIFGDRSVTAVNMVVFGDGGNIRVQTKDQPTRFILMTGTSFKEPIAPYGPFVMNTPEEIQQALADLRNGTFVRE
jgi:redox-sensitive bicupin YhaK (pirin superfamily)